MNIWESETVVRAVGWTLVHFVWEGLAIAAVLAASLRLMRRSPAQWRYLAGCAAMLAMAVAPLATFQVVLGQDGPPAATLVMTPVTPTMPGESSLSADRPAAMETLPIAQAKTPSIVGDDVRSLKYFRFFGLQLKTPYVVCCLIDEMQSQRIEDSMPWLVMAWLVGVCLLSCRLLAGWWQVRRLARTACCAAGIPWEQKLAELARRLGINRSICLLQSALVEVPTVIGWLRPVILLPASCLTGLTPGQLEAILAHELAHIERHDYLINLLQSALETLLFYHPAVWWVSRKVREERENCCDDLAVAVSGDRVGYARALATLEELRPASAQLALAASGAPLLRRIRRLVAQPERSAGHASWPVAGIVLLLGLGLVALGMRQHRAQAAEQGTASEVKPPEVPAQSGSQAQMQAMDIQQIVTSAVMANSNSADAANPNSEHHPELTQEKKNSLQYPASNSDAVHPSEQVINEWDVPARVRALAQNGVPNTDARQSNVVNTSPGRKLIFDKLRRIPIESLNYTDLPLTDVLDDLSAKARAMDPDGAGINFFFSHPTTPTVDEKGNLVGAAQPDQPDATTIKITLSLKNVTLAQALDGLFKTADPPIQYSVLDYGIVFSLRTNEPVPLEIRSFKVDRNWFPINLIGAAGAGGLDGGGANGTNVGNSSPMTADTLNRQVEEQVRAYFAGIGLDLSTNSGKAVIWNERKGMLTIRATPDDLDLIEKALEAPAEPGSAPVAPMNPDASSIIANLPANPTRLEQIRVDANYSGLPLQEVLDDLHRRTQAADPAGQGINFLFRRFDPNPTRAGSAPVTVQTALRDVPVSQVLAAITSGSSRPVRYSVTDYGVVFSLVDMNQPPTLKIWSFLVANSSFGAALRAATGTDLSSGREAVQTAVRKYFAAKGIDLSTNGGKAVIYNDRRGILTIRATEDDLDVIEKTLQVVNAAKPQVNIKVKFVEITQNDTQAMGFQWKLGGTAVGTKGATVVQGGPMPSLQGLPSPVNPPGLFPGTTNTPAAVTVAPAVAAPQVQGLGSNAAAGQQNAPRLASLTGILTDPQYAVVLQALEQRDGTEILMAPEVTTESGTQAQIQAVDMQQIGTSNGSPFWATWTSTNTAGGTTTGPRIRASKPGTNTFSFGPELDVVPYVTADQNAVQMALIPSVTDFIGYTNAGQFVPEAALPTGGTITAVLPLPHFRLRQSVTNVTVWDGQTVVLGGWLTDSTSDTGQVTKRNLMIFVTVTLVNHDGTLFHTQAERDALGNSPASAIRK